MVLLFCQSYFVCFFMPPCHVCACDLLVWVSVLSYSLGVLFVLGGEEVCVVCFYSVENNDYDFV